MKILEFKRDIIYDIGFIDPDKVNEYTIQHHAKETDDLLLRFIKRQNNKPEILFPYNFE